MAKSETYINFIIDQLRNDNISHNEVMTVFVSKFRLSERQFTRYWTKANELYIKELQTIEKEKKALRMDAELKAAKVQIADDLETKKSATKTLRMATNALKKEGLKDEPDLKVIVKVCNIIVNTRKTLGYEKLSVNSDIGLNITVNPVTIDIPSDTPD